MKEIMGGCWFAGLLAWALLGFLPGLILFILGFIVCMIILYKEHQSEIAEQAWRKNYPSYKY